MTATSMTRPRVAFLSDAQEFAGAERYMIFLLAGLRERFDFVVVAGTRADQELRDKAAGEGAHFLGVEGLERRPGLVAPVRLARALRRLHPALVHVNLSDQGDGVAPLLAGRFVGAPVVATLHNVIPGRSHPRETVSNALLHIPQEVIAVSDRLGRYLQGRRAHNVVVRNAVPPPVLDPRARERLRLRNDVFVVGGIGRLHAQKGWDVLCRAAALVHAERPEICFVVVGEGPEREALMRMPEASHVHFHGYVPDASSLLGAFDLLVIPSRYEGLGLVAIEGMFAGVPILASDIEGLGEAIGDAGRLVPSEDVQALADAILALAADRSQLPALASHAVERAHNTFSYDHMIEQTARVYDRVLDSA